MLWLGGGVPLLLLVETYEEEDGFLPRRTFV
jgi:hypothetical protein